MRQVILITGILASIASANAPTVGIRNRFGDFTAPSGVAGSGYAPLPVNNDAGAITTSPHQYVASNGGSGIRFDEQKWTNVVYTQATRRLSKTGLGKVMKHALYVGETDGDEAEWTLSAAGTTTYYFKDGTLERRAEPIGLTINGATAVKGTCGALTAGQWGFCNILATEGSGADEGIVYVRLSDGTDPDSKADGYVTWHRGAGTHLQAESSAGSVALAWFAFKAVLDADTIQLYDDFHPGGNLSDVTIYQAVRTTRLDLEYSWTATTGTVDAISLGNRIPNLPSQTIQTNVGRTHLWGVTLIPNFGTTEICVTGTDLANSGSDTTCITVNETAWPGNTVDYFADATNGLDTNPGTQAQPFQTWNKALDAGRLVAVGVPRRIYFKRGGTFPSANAAQWSHETNETLITAYGTGANPIVTNASGSAMFDSGDSSGQPSANIRITDIDFVKTDGTGKLLIPCGAGNLFLRINLTSTTALGPHTMLERGSGVCNYDDSLIWDSTFTRSGATGNDQYMIYDSSASSSGNRVIYEGVKFVHDGTAVIRSNHESGQRIGNCWIVQMTATNNTPPLRLMRSDGVVLHRNYVQYAEDVDGFMNNGCDGSCGSGFSKSLEISENYIEAPTTVAVGNNIVTLGQPGRGTTGVGGPATGPVLIKNNTVIGGTRFVTTLNAGGQIRWLQLYHNTWYTTKTQGQGNQFVSTYNNGGNYGFDLIDARNNAIYVNGSNTSNDRLIWVASPFGWPGSVTIDANQVYWGTSSAGKWVTLAASVYDSGTNGITAGETAWQTARLGQNNAIGNPQFTSITSPFDFTPQPGSPLLNAAVPLATVMYDQRGQLRDGTPTIGSIEVTAAATGKCCECNGTCSVITQAACAAIGGTYGGDSTTCGTCPVGGCCGSSQGSCTVITDACCLDTYAGDGTTCADCMGKCCSRTGGCTVTKQANCNSSNAQWTWGGTCGTCATEACCTGASCADLTSYACTAEAGSPQGAGSDCSPNPCAVPTGSCCKVDGSCMVTDQTTCTAIAEAIWSSGGVCSPNTCAPAGACCKSNQTCENETSAGCTTDGGTWLGSGTSCIAGLCDIRACCTAGPTCNLTIATNCAGTFLPTLTSCTGTPCNQKACCDGVGGCADTFQALCTGTWHASNVCTENPCITVGACCFANALCFVGSATLCTSNGGTYAGNGTTCDIHCVGGCWSNNCSQCANVAFADCPSWEGLGTTCVGTTPCVTGACIVDSGCFNYHDNACTYFGGVYFGDGTICVVATQILMTGVRNR